MRLTSKKYNCQLGVLNINATEISNEFFGCDGFSSVITNAEVIEVDAFSGCGNLFEFKAENAKIIKR